MSQIQTKWIEDNAITPAKLDSSSTFTMSGLVVSGKIGVNTVPQPSSDAFTIREASGTPAIRLDNADGVLGRPYRLMSDSQGSFDIVDASSLATRLTINRSGLLGLGTTNPQAEFHVLTNASPARFALDTGASRFVLDTDNTTGNFFIAKTGGTGSFGIDGAGHIIGGAVLGGDTTVAGRLLVTGDTTVQGGFEVSGTVTVHNVEQISSGKIVVEHATNDPAILVDNTNLGTGLFINNINPSANAIIVNQGAVGLGTTVPLAPLHVQGGAAFYAGTVTENNSGDALNGSYFMNVGGTNTFRFVQYPQSHASRANQSWVDAQTAGNTLTLSTQNTARVTVDTIGQLGIGSTVPSSLVDIQNNGVGGISAGLIKYTSPSNYGSASWQVSNPAGGNLLAINAYKNVPVPVYGNLSALNLNAIESANSSGLIVATSSAAPLFFGTSALVQMTIDPTGQIGIGTTAPNVGSGANVHLYRNDSGTSIFKSENHNATGSEAFILANDSGSITAMYQFNSSNPNPYGSVGANGMSALISQTNTGFLIETTHAAPLYFGAADQTWMTLSALGRLGIGSTTPDQQLIVAAAGAQSIECVDTFNSSSGLNTGSVLRFRRSKSAALGSNVATADGDEIGRIDFHGDSGGGFLGTAVSYISSVQTGVSTTTGGHLIFATANNSGGNAVERVRISEDARSFVGIGSTQPTANVDITSNTAFIRGKSLYSTGSANLLLSNDLLYTGSDVQGLHMSLTGSGTAGFTCFGISVAGSVATILSETNYGSGAPPLFIGNAGGPPFNPYNGAIYFGVGGASGGQVALTIDGRVASLGSIGIGSTQPDGLVNAASGGQLLSAWDSYSSASGSNTGATNIKLRRSKSDVVGVNVATGDQDELGQVSFYGNNGASWSTNRIAFISAVQSGVSTSISGVISFGAASGGGAAVERMRLQGSLVGIGTTAPRRQLDVIGTALVSQGLGVGTSNPGGGHLSPSTTDFKTSMVFNTVDKAGNDFVVGDQDYIILSGGRPVFAGGPQIATLPSIASQPVGRVLIFKNISPPAASLNTVVTCSGADQFDIQSGPALTAITLGGNGKLWIVNNGTNWSILGQ